MFLFACNNYPSKTNNYNEIYQNVKGFPRNSYSKVMLISIKEEYRDVDESNSIQNIEVVNNKAQLYNGEKNEITSKVRQIELKGTMISKLDTIFKLAPANSPVADKSCFPIFRDAIVFLKKDNSFSGAILICFQCEKTILLHPSNNEILFANWGDADNRWNWNDIRRIFNY